MDAVDEEEDDMPLQMTRQKMSTDSSEQLRVLVSASKTSGTFARDQVIRQSQRSSLLDLSDLSDCASKLDDSYSNLVTVLSRVDNFAMPVAAGKAAKLKIDGFRLLHAVKERESEAKALKELLKGSSDKIKDLIKKPYVLKNDESLELLLVEHTPEVLQWSQLVGRVESFCSDAQDVMQTMSRYAKSA